MKSRRQHTVVFRTIILLTACLSVAGYIGLNQTGAGGDEKRGATVAEGKANAAEASAAFRAAYAVFSHPRCMNCHPAGDAPLQGDDGRPHAFRVRRGPDGNGLPAMRCSNCHQAANLPGAHTPPGAPYPPEAGEPHAKPRWHLPPPQTAMTFEGKTAAQLCQQLKDRRRNGGLSLEQLIQHVNHDPLVLWGWSPGEGRTTPPLSHAEFVRKIEESVRKGGACPE